MGAGTGTVAFGWKGGIGTASRRLPAKLGGYTVGVLVQTNFGGVLMIAGAPVGQELGQYYLHDELRRDGASLRNGAGSPLSRSDESRHYRASRRDFADGSVIVVVATDAPLDGRNLKRLAARALLGVARTGSAASNGSGDYGIAFSTAMQVRIHTEDTALTHHVEL